MARTVLHGIDKVHLYPIKSGNYEPGIKQIGARGFNLTVTKTDTTFYADDRKHVVIPGLENLEGDLTLAQIEDTVLTDILGYTIQINGTLVDGASPTSCALAVVQKETADGGTSKRVVTILYDVLPAKPSKAAVTDEEAQTQDEMVLTFTAKTTDRALSDTGKPCASLVWRVPEDVTDAELDTALQTLILPTSTLPGGDSVAPVINVTSTNTTAIVGALVDKAWLIANNGLSVIDNVDGDITSTIKVTTTGTINTSVVNTSPQPITINAIDEAGNTSTKIVSITIVAAPDTIPPVITTNATSKAVVINTVIDKAYLKTALALTVVDNVDGDIVDEDQTSLINIPETGVANATPQILTIQATDLANNTSSKDISFTVTATAKTMTKDK